MKKIRVTFHFGNKLIGLLILNILILTSFANIEAQRYQLTVQTDGTPGAKVSPSGTFNVRHGQSRKIKVSNIPPGYSFTKWTEEAGSATIEDIFAQTTDVALTSGDATIQANFSQEIYSLNVKIQGQGSVTKNPSLTGYRVGTTVILTPVPASGWSFSNWSGDESGSDNPLTITMNEDKNITAIFTSKTSIAVLSGSSSICSGESTDLTISFIGEMPWEVVYTDGDDNTTLSGISKSPAIISVSPQSTKTYNLVSVKDSQDNQGLVAGSATVTVTQLPVGGTVTGDNSRIVVTRSTGPLTLSGHSGTILRWQRSINSNDSWTNITNTESTYQETPESTGIYRYRAVIQSGTCGTANSEPFEIMVSPSPVINNANFDASNGNLIINGQNLSEEAEIDLKKLTISSGEKSFIFTNTANVKPSSSTQATIVVTGTDKALLNWILNNNFLNSKEGNPYNISAKENWNGMALADPTNAIAVSEFQPPSIISAVYNKLTSTLVVTASRLAAAPEPVKDIDAKKFSITGKNNNSFTLTSATQDVNVQSETGFIITLSQADKGEVEHIIDIGGATSSTGHPYKLFALNRWNRPVHQDYDISDLIGKQILAQGFENQPPVVSNIEITGSPEIGLTLTGNYTYYDIEGDPEGNSQFAWYRADDLSGTGKTLIEGENRKSYTLAIDDAKKFIAFEVTPVALSGTTPGNPIRSAYLEVKNSPPSVTNVEITGTLAVCKILTASYEYFDAEGDPEGNTRITWYRTDNVPGANEEEINEGPEYTVTIDDEGKYIRVKVTPYATQGVQQGIQVSGVPYGPILNTLPTASVTGPGESCQGAPVDLIFNLSGTGPWTGYYTDGNNEYNFTAAGSPHIVTVTEGGTYKVTYLTDSEGCEGTELGGEFNLNTLPTLSIEGGYTETFENTLSDWTTAMPPGGLANSWTFGQPDGDTFTSASAGGNIWYTDISDKFVAEQSWVGSPCFDFTATKRPMIAVDIWKEFGIDNDGAVLQYSADNGSTWENIGETGNGINWYNSSQIAGLPGGQSTGWTATDPPGDTGWQESKHDLDIIAGKTNIRFRIAYGSDGMGGTKGGLAFDNIRIGDRSRVVLLEHFTNATHVNSIESGKIINEISKSYPNDFAHISYHTSFPDSDPFNNRNPADPSARALYYGVSGVPYSIMDGGSESVGRFDYSNVVFNSKDLLKRALVSPGFKIEITQNQSGDQLNLSVLLTSLQSLESSALTLYIAIVETEVDASTAGLHTNVVYRNTVRKLLPDAGGYVLPANWTPDQSENLNFNWTINNVFDSEKLATVAFIQNEITGEIYQTGNSSQFDIPTPIGIVNTERQVSNIIFYPNPATDHFYIQFKEVTTADHFVEIYNIQGKLVYSNVLRKGSSLYDFNISQLQSGAYLFRVRSNFALAGTSRIIIN